MNEAKKLLNELYYKKQMAKDIGAYIWQNKGYFDSPERIDEFTQVVVKEGLKTPFYRDIALSQSIHENEEFENLIREIWGIKNA